jgi:hypothetical protein
VVPHGRKTEAFGRKKDATIWRKVPLVGKGIFCGQKKMVDVVE